MRFSKEQQLTIDSLKKVDDNIYSLHYQSDYGRDFIVNSNPKGFLKAYRNMQLYFKSCKPLLNPFVPKGGCVGITAFNNNDDTLFARNFDYKESNCLILFNDCKDGYKSLCMADFTFMAYGKKHLRIENSNKARLLASPYACMDGVNEKGLAASIIEVKFDPTRQETGKSRLYPTILLRLILDTCGSIDEVTNTIQQYDIYGVLGNDYHYHVCDRNGNSAVYEFIDNKMHIIKNNSNGYYKTRYMYVPSFFIAKEGNNKNITVYAKDRYDLMKEDMIKRDGIYKENDLMKLLEKCKTNHPHRWMPHTVVSVWSVVYNLKECSAIICSNNNFNDVYKVNLFKPLEIIKLDTK